ncbi:carboxylesterase family protein [Streptomyces sp. WI04-05B]|uniref:carboxylesterase family protein n=1 Tax=Streptomyces TaxID=1883 RepID=UPI0029B7DD63|nr:MULTISPECIES: carboxylesterase family protein [unclassified Streptomyces]MDX2543449.1 carboxylesterase family protein [Streptomyces sp. WI04-05B]MDX2589118.1 carboxylesterase family protein [Streptomyces sp. WI04-05A]MDX3746621.1 carboxylesterase family protein [Streptomyces sp. AK08-02]
MDHLEGIAVTVQAPAGPVVGRRTGPVQRFLGIPYAQPPTGARRFAAPVARDRFPEPFDASRHGPTSQRVPLFPTTTVPEPSVPGDDILNLSVVAPASSAGHASPCPVLVWIHGGAFLAGSPASPWYDGRSFARDGVVHVTVGYRLGVDGFAPLDDVPTNLGLRDLLLALAWVRENIGAFGGDPGRVTLAGQSAGGAAVLALLSSPAANGLFQRAVSVSGVLVEGDREPARRFVERLGKRLGVPATGAGFGRLAVERLQRAVLDLRDELGDVSLSLGPVTGDDVLPVSVSDGLAGHGHDVPLLLGATGDEFDCEAAPGNEHPSPYGVAELAAARAAGSRVTDTLFRAACPRVAAARRAAGAGTWLYSFEWPSPVLGGAAHCVDIPFFFDLLDAPGIAEALGPYPPVELATAIHADLVGFVHGGEPGWARARGGHGDPAREYGRPGAALVADTAGVFDPVAGTEYGAEETC